MKEKNETKTDITQRGDGMWIVDAKLSAVRIGLQDKEFVKRGHNLDYRLWITDFEAREAKLRRPPRIPPGRTASNRTNLRVL